MTGLAYLDHTYQQGTMPHKLYAILKDFHNSYLKAVLTSGCSSDTGEQLFRQLVELACQHIEHPHFFHIFHRSLRAPFDYYQFGLDFIRPLIDFKRSAVLGLNYVDQMIDQLQRQENVILLANHQTEPDPQIIDLLVTPHRSNFVSQMIFIAGHRVVKDPVAVPMSLGRNLLCIYSKKYIEHPPEERHKKILHNQRTMQKMKDLLNQGGQCIYVAPSGGRDRPNTTGYVDIDPLNPQSLEMFWLMAKRASHPTHFYPLSLLTYPLFPPPYSVEKELGEKREAYYNPVYLAFGKEIQMDDDSDNMHVNKKDQRQQRAKWVEEIIRNNYQQLVQLQNAP